MTLIFVADGDGDSPPSHIFGITHSEREEHTKSESHIPDYMCYCCPDSEVGPHTLLIINHFPAKQKQKQSEVVGQIAQERCTYSRVDSLNFVCVVL